MVSSELCKNAQRLLKVKLLPKVKDKILIALYTKAWHHIDLLKPQNIHKRRTSKLWLRIQVHVLPKTGYDTSSGNTSKVSPRELSCILNNASRLNKTLKFLKEDPLWVYILAILFLREFQTANLKCLTRVAYQRRKFQASWSVRLVIQKGWLVHQERYKALEVLTNLMGLQINWSSKKTCNPTKIGSTMILKDMESCHTCHIPLIMSPVKRLC